MRQADLIALLAQWLKSQRAVAGAFLGGSFGRGDADDYSDVDIYVVTAESAQIQTVANALADGLDRVTSILFSKTLPNARTINAITTEWLRFDLTVVSPPELAFLAKSELEPLFDRSGALETIRHSDQQPPTPTPDHLLDIVNEFIRVLGLTVVVKGRDDVVVAQNGVELLRGMLIRVMVMENRPQCRRGVLALRQDLTTDQFTVLAALPPLQANWPSIFARTTAISREFLPRARRLAAELGATWPEEFERVTRAHLDKQIGQAGLIPTRCEP
ncbi:MAG: nucleotidyltransferase domain-containing protein [Gammaproteobacteria bacterium]|nr:nucleotidyltransferase domain-containing protein [Gammaproteobacteria bacterium]MYF28837.1 nucleotidyltransferase domain-containing protein [Gammaproteobacteria bacterium]MYK44626.1 nucleotidyltransferase domain-containing protein [Gammaproteobacteria bacterium]